MIPRRGFLVGLGALLAAPAIIRTPGLVMPVKPLPLVVGVDLGRDHETLVFMSTPSGLETGLIWKFWADQAEKDVDWLKGLRWTEEEVARMRRVG